MDYEKKYNEALERAKYVLHTVETAGCAMHKDLLTEIFPELRESEDERIRKWLADYFSSIKKTVWIHRDITCEQILAWLEKQKENPKNAISIPADCVSDAKCEDRWHKTANSLPDDGRDVLAKDALGNYLLASFDGAQWFVSVYDGEDHPVLHTPPILEWCEIHSEKQKEQKPATTEDMPYITDEHFYEREPADSFKYKLAEYMTRCCTKKEGPYGYTYGISAESILKMAKEELLKRGELKEQKPINESNMHEPTLDEARKWNEAYEKGYSLGYENGRNVQKPVEWSEEDEKIIQSLILEVNKYVFFAGIEANKIVSFLKSLRPSWKPREEDKQCLDETIELLGNLGYDGEADNLKQLKKKI